MEEKIGKILIHKPLPQFLIQTQPKCTNSRKSKILEQQTLAYEIQTNIVNSCVWFTNNATHFHNKKVTIRKEQQEKLKKITNMSDQSQVLNLSILAHSLKQTTIDKYKQRIKSWIFHFSSYFPKTSHKKCKQRKWQLN